MKAEEDQRLCPWQHEQALSDPVMIVGGGVQWEGKA